MNATDLRRVEALGVDAGESNPDAAPTNGDVAAPPAAAAPASSRPRYLTALAEASDPPKHPRSFRPTEVVRDMYVGGIRDCKSISALHYATGARLVVRACPMAKAPAFEVMNLPAPGAKSVAPDDAHQPRAPCRTMPEFLHALATALDAERNREQFVAAVAAAKREADVDDDGDDSAAETKPKASHGPSRRAVGVVTLLQAQDLPSYDMKQHFEAIASAIKTVWADRGLPVVVHCAAGVSRSVSLVIAFLLAHFDGYIDPTSGSAPETLKQRGVLGNRVSVADALRLIQARRPQAGPNDGFMKQLNEWQKRHQRRTRSNSVVSESGSEAS